MGLLLVLFLATLFLLFWLLGPDNAAGKKEKKLSPEANLPPISQRAMVRPPIAAAISQGDETWAGTRPAPTEVLYQKLANIKSEYKKLDEELSNERDAQLKLKDEVERLKASLERDSGLEEKLRTENKEFKEKLVSKGQEYEKEFGLNLNLARELGEVKQKSAVLEQQRRQDEERLNILEAQNKAYKEEVKRLNQEILELNKKSQESQWVSRKEYEDLRAKLKEKENA